jgi:outer membrane biosynthesis protein TonB
MQKKYVYSSIIFHIAIVLLCVIDISFLSNKREFDEQPPIIVDLNDVKISDMTNIPELAVRGEERKVATRKDEPNKEVSSAVSTPQQQKNNDIKEPEPEKVEEVEVKSPSLIEIPAEEPKKESKEPIKEKKKPAPIPQRKPQVKPNKKPEQKKKPEPKKTNQTTSSTNKNKKTVKNANPLQSLMNSVDDLQKQIGEENAPAQIPYDEPVNNMGIEGGNSKGSYFSELSVSGIDFVKSKIQESWKTTVGGKDDRNIEVVINVFLTKEGIIQNVKIEDMRRYRSDKYFQALADSAERAIYIAQDAHGVFKVLSAQSGSKYNEWKNIRFTFTPLGLVK